MNLDLLLQYACQVFARPQHTDSLAKNRPTQHTHSASNTMLHSQDDKLRATVLTLALHLTSPIGHRLTRPPHAPRGARASAAALCAIPQCAPGCCRRATARRRASPAARPPDPTTRRSPPRSPSQPAAPQRRRNLILNPARPAARGYCAPRPRQARPGPRALPAAPPPARPRPRGPAGTAQAAGPAAHRRPRPPAEPRPPAAREARPRAAAARPRAAPGRRPRCACQHLGRTAQVCHALHSPARALRCRQHSARCVSFYVTAIWDTEGLLHLRRHCASGPPRTGRRTHAYQSALPVGHRVWVPGKDPRTLT